MLVGAAAALAGGAGERPRRQRLKRLALPDDPVRRRLFWGAEIVFAVIYALGVLFASFAPDVWNTEKPMDMAFITALNASEHFPPHDPWMSGETLNYYYLGHLVLAWPIKLLGLRPDAGYLLCWGALIGAHRHRGLHVRGHAVGGRAGRPCERAPRGGPVFAGLVAAALVAILGNLAGVRTWLRADDPPRDYAWFEPSRVIPNTINEFPSFSFVLGDLHAHVIALPFTVLALAFALQVALHGPRGDLLWRAVAEALAAALARRVAVRDQLVVVSGRRRAAGRGGDRLAARPERGRTAYSVVWLGLVLVASFVLILPFVLNFAPGGARHRRRLHAPAVRQVARRHGADLRHPRCGRWSGCSRGGCSTRRTAGAGSAGASRRRSSAARCWPPRT